MSLKAKATIKRQVKTDPQTGNKSEFAVLSLFSEDGTELGQPRIFSGGYPEAAVVLRREAGVPHEVFHERFPGYKRDEEVVLYVTFENEQAIRDAGFTPPEQKAPSIKAS